MSGSTITGTITTTVTLDTGTYTSPLTIASTGDVAPTAYGAIGVYGSTSSGLITLANYGTVTGGAGTLGTSGTAGGTGGTGGIGVDLTSGYLLNQATIEGGAGGNGGGYAGPAGIGGPGGDAGIGVLLASGTISNDGIIIGGAGGTGGPGSYLIGHSGPGGLGADGVYLDGGFLDNLGTIRGGAGGIGGAGTYSVEYNYGMGGGTGGDGSYGVELKNGTVTEINAGTITGGNGGNGGNGANLDPADTLAGHKAGSGGNGGNGGGAIDLASGTLSNTGIIIGGNGGDGGDGGTASALGGNGGNGGTGGTGIDIGAGAVTNSDSIVGGNGGNGGNAGIAGTLAFNHITNTLGPFGINDRASGAGGAGGTGVSLTASTSTLTNDGSVAGGGGGTAGYGGFYGGAGGAGGVGVSLAAGALLINNGIITGGAGGSGGYQLYRVIAGGNGGAGVVMGSGTLSGTLTASGTISGGAGGYGGKIQGLAGPAFGNDSDGGNGGDGASLSVGLVTASGIISGGDGGYGWTRGGAGGAGVALGSGTVIASGSISGGSAGDAKNYFGGNGGIGVDVTGSGTVIASGTISGGNGGSGASSGGNGGAGVFLDSGTVIASGTIEGGTAGTGFNNGYAGDAVRLGAGVGTVIVDPGAVLVGNVVANRSVADVLDLTSASSAGTITGIGTSFAGFRQITIDTGATWDITGTNRGGGYTTFTNYGTLANLDIFAGVNGANGSSAGPFSPLPASYGTTAPNGTNGGNGGNGAVGLVLAGSSGVLTNAGSITGGAGGSGGNGGEGAYTYVSGNFGYYGLGFLTPRPTGGTAGTGGSGGNGGTGGIGVDLTSGTISNSGVIIGGNGGGAGAGGPAGGTFVLTQTIAGYKTLSSGLRVPVLDQYTSTFVGGPAGVDGTAAVGAVGVYLDAGVLINSGTIAGGTSAVDGSVSDAVQFGTGVGTLVVDPGAVFVGNVAANSSYADVLDLGSGSSAGTITGIGTSFAGFQQITVDSGATWDLTGSNSIAGSTSLVDVGTLVNTGSLQNAGVLDAAGVLVNAGTITAANPSGDAVQAAYGTVVVDPGAVFVGKVAANLNYAIVLDLASASSAGTITGIGTSFTGFQQITIDAGATWDLTGSNSIAAYTTFTNAGTLLDTGSMVNAGYLQNAGTLLDAGVLVNAGTIAGTNGGAVQFGTSVGTLVVDPGAVFLGSVAANSSYADVLDLTAGGSAGTITGISTSFAGFQQIRVDAGATWDITGSNSIGTYTTLTDSGTLVDVGTVVNAGLIVGTGGTPGNSAIVINGGSLGNGAAGTIKGGSGINFSPGHQPTDGGIGVDQIAGTGSNAGLITGGAGGNNGIYAGNGGDALYLQAGSLDNSGTILGGAGGSGNHGGTAGAGAYLLAGTLTNSGSIGGGKGGSGYTLGVDGGVGVSLQSGTLITSGTISGGARGTFFGPSGTNGVAGDAVDFGTGVGTLVVDPGAVFVGSVVANATVADVLEFGAGTVAGTLAGVGTQFENFNDFSFAAGASFDVSGTYTAFDSGQTIDGFAVGDTLVLDGFGATTHTYVSGVGLELGNGATEITVDIAGSFTTSDFTVIDPPLNTTISLNASQACFAAGTRIRLARGEITVERLVEGDEVVLASGGTAPIKWIGRRRLDLRHHPKPETVLPVLIEAGAIAEGVPCRDLYVSPDHALFLDGHLIPAKALINGTTIRQVKRRSITYYHVELPEHAVLFADGMPAESYLETGNRGAFANGGEPVILHPDFAQTLREEQGCAPFAEDGAVVEGVRTRIFARAAIATIAGPAITTTADPALTIRTRADGSAVIESRSAIPAHLTPDLPDYRRLGVKVARLTAGGADIPIDHPSLIKGWHAVEPDGRWTDGAAVIPAFLLNGNEPVLTIFGTLQYPLAATEAEDREAKLA